MEEDFRGWATKAGLKCSDGRTIMPDAFKHQDTMQVPLVWQHGHTNPENVLGHVRLENRPEGVYAYGFFNNSPAASHARELVEHKDINALSIWANKLVERSKMVLHGAIREVSLVLSGANPGALIEHVRIQHSDGDESELEDEAIIFTGLELEHSDGAEDKGEEPEKSDGAEDKGEEPEEEGDDNVEHADMDKSLRDVYETMNEEQQAVVHVLVAEAMEAASEANHSDTDTKGDDTVRHNVFEDDKKDATPSFVLSHDDMKGILEAAKAPGNTLKAAVEEFALSHGIDDIDVLFPDAKTITDAPELQGRRVEWVAKLLGAVTKRPFSRIKTIAADITVPEARAKGYITGTLKKEEFFKVSSRVTHPTTIYKKQKLDRDDIVDITDFDVVAWLKAEMRVMLDEELARAILVGDGRAPGSEDKIDEDSIRPIASDHELYTTTITVNIDDANSDMTEVIDELALNRHVLRGSGLPMMFTSERYIARFLLTKDNDRRKLYKNVEEFASDVRVSAVVSVEILEEYDDIVCILVNPADYSVGATAGGQVSMFDDFDIDYNQYKYLIETRVSGALTKWKSAMVVRKTAAGNTLVAPASPVWDQVANTVTIVDTAGVTYRNAETDAVMNAAGSPYTVAPDTTLTVHATANAGRYIASTEDDDWAFPYQD